MDKKNKGGLLNTLMKMDIYLGCTFFAVLVLLVIANVVTRYVFNTGFSWAEELVLILFAWSTYFGIAVAYRYDTHIKVDFIFKMFPKGFQRVLDIVIEIALVVLAGFFSYLSVILCTNVGNKRTLVMRLPANVVNLTILVCFAIITISGIVKIYKKIKGTYMPEDPMADIKEIVID